MKDPQTRYLVFDLSDIVNIRIVCANLDCRGETMCPLDTDYKMLRRAGGLRCMIAPPPRWVSM